MVTLAPQLAPQHNAPNAALLQDESLPDLLPDLPEGLTYADLRGVIRILLDGSIDSLDLPDLLGLDSHADVQILMNAAWVQRELNALRAIAAARTREIAANAAPAATTTLTRLAQSQTPDSNDPRILARHTSTRRLAASSILRLAGFTPARRTPPTLPAQTSPPEPPFPTDSHAALDPAHAPTPDTISDGVAHIEPPIAQWPFESLTDDDARPTPAPNPTPPTTPAHIAHETAAPTAPSALINEPHARTHITQTHTDAQATTSSPARDSPAPWPAPSPDST
jgi:hypothetical protein